METLRQEINRLAADQFDLQKWKLIAVALVSVFGLGWTKQYSPAPYAGLFVLCSIGFLCAYVDFLYYRRAIMIHVIAKSIRDSKVGEADPQKRYEDLLNEMRRKGMLFLSDRYAQIASSFLFSVVLPVAGFVRYCQWHTELFVFSLLGLGLVVWLYWLYVGKRSGVIAEIGPNS